MTEDTTRDLMRAVMDICKGLGIVLPPTTTRKNFLPLLYTATKTYLACREEWGNRPKKPRYMRMSVQHAPRGGVRLQGKFFPGGEFIPAGVLAKATPAEKAKVKGAPAKVAVPDLKPSPGLTPEDAKIEQTSWRRAHTQYDTLRDKYLEKTASFDDSGNLKSVVLNTDEWRDLFPEYTGTNASAVHEASSQLNKRLYADSLEEMKGKGNGKLVVLAGGGGSGKGTAVGQFFDEAQYPIRLDQVSDNLKKLEDKLDEATANGYKPEYIFVDRHPVDAWNGVVGRAMNLAKKGKLPRTVPLKLALKANLKARETAIELLKKRKDIAPKIINNNNGFGKADLIEDREEAIKFLEAQKHNHEELYEKLFSETLARHESGEINKDIAQGLLGKEAIK